MFDINVLILSLVVTTGTKKSMIGKAFLDFGDSVAIKMFKVIGRQLSIGFFRLFMKNIMLATVCPVCRLDYWILLWTIEHIYIHNRTVLFLLDKCYSYCNT